MFRFLRLFLTGIYEYQNFLQEILFLFLEQVEGVGIISGEEAKNWGLSGPMPRASKISWNLHAVAQNECYTKCGWEVQWQKEGDYVARYLVRLSEMRESIKIIQQALEEIMKI